MAGQYQAATQDSRAAVPAEGEITLVPEADAIEFNPQSRTFRWLESVHREDFRLRASPAVADGTTHVASRFATTPARTSVRR
jgi:hypothetical protein